MLVFLFPDVCFSIILSHCVDGASSWIRSLTNTFPHYRIHRWSWRGSRLCRESGPGRASCGPSWTARWAGSTSPRCSCPPSTAASRTTASVSPPFGVHCLFSDSNTSPSSRWRACCLQTLWVWPHCSPCSPKSSQWSPAARTWNCTTFRSDLLHITQSVLHSQPLWEAVESVCRLCSLAGISLTQPSGIKRV